MPAPKTFIREATGLVREISFFDHLITNMNGVVPMASMVLTPWWIWFAVPGGDPLFAMLGGYLFGVFGTLVTFAMISATFPRSAAPYVATSRVLHPAIGWPAEVLQWIGWGPLGCTFAGELITWALVPGFYTMGVSSGNPALIATAYALGQPLWVFIVGTVIFTLIFAVSVLGTRRVVRTFQLPITVLMFIGIIGVMILWSSGSPAQLQALLPKYLHTDYNSIISTAKSSFPVSMAPYNYGSLTILMGLGFTVGAFNSYWNSWAVGEVKRANDIKMEYLSMIIPSTVMLLLTAGTLAIAQSTVGRDFLIAMNQIMTYNPSFFQNVPSSFIFGSSTITFVPMILADNTMVQLLLMVGITGAVMCYLPLTWLMISRQLFAWSFDRLLPAKFAEVSDRFHTPVFNLLVNYILVEVFLVLIVFTPQYFGAILAASWAMTILPLAIYMLAGMLMPLRKEIWSTSPANKYKIGPVPLVVIAGIIGFIFMANGTWFFSTTAALGFGLPQTEIVLAMFAVPFIIYWPIRALRKRQGINIDLVFRTVPPE